MFEYHGWTTVQHSAGDESGAQFEGAYRATEEIVRCLRSGQGMVDTRIVNGSAQLHLAGLLNHCGTEGKEIIDSFRKIGTVAPGSYGVMYIWDDEDRSGLINEFQVMVMKRGQVTVVRDTHLSPCVPAIEDEF
ncbi:Imm7 family immunity protein [Nocardia sp. R7R-8]|uniref:Imm7 family immunity protein n=1 Tax=Nocardia sp. R7R-8 TaxID=3459304 RepID=UPI00403D9C96